jgi:LmbE family N-acetylglucosaminyl deacetylase
VLDQVAPRWRIAGQLASVEAALASVAGIDTSAQRRQWQAWVDQLADPSFSRRREADQALRAAGQGVLAHLRQLDPATLDLEQRRRIRAIVAAIADSSPDSPERVANWLAGDKRVWIVLLGRGDESGRQAAARQLSLLCGRPVAVDPAASDDQREQQLVELKALLAER